MGAKGCTNGGGGLPSLDVPVWPVTHRDLQTSRHIGIVLDLPVRGPAEKAGAGVGKVDRVARRVQERVRPQTPAAR